MWSIWVNQHIKSHPWAGGLRHLNEYDELWHKPVSLDRKFALLLGLLILVQAVDALMTQSLVTVGLVKESNPFVSNMIGSGLFIPLKIAGLIISSAVLWWIYRRLPRICMIILLSMLLFYNGVLFWNMSVLM
ncbi:hypothetical protein DGWBC_1618 [Dehalogenimonas sp. WBC-2]|nr:hypothetical protein DGWBC_1618 [Dehalogenimonas sp. WBC-2]